MITVLSPSKGQDFESLPPTHHHTIPDSLAQSEQLIQILKTYDQQAIQKLMSVSEAIAQLNRKRFQQFSTPFTKDNAKPCIFAFKGDVYSGLGALQFSEEALRFSQQHLRILSGLYGALRPLDLIQPYRLEMKTKLATIKGKDLYAFWGNQITDSINKSLSQQDDKTIINLASNEYFKAIKPKQLIGKVLTITFKETKKGQSRVIAIFAKRARGMMADYIIRNQLTNPEKIKLFSMAGYRFSNALSCDKQWVFERPQPQPKT